MDMKFISSKVERNVALVEMFNEKKNALCYELLLELKNAFQEIEANGEVRAVILSGKGDSFCSGMDVEWLLKEDSIVFRQFD